MDGVDIAEVNVQRPTAYQLLQRSQEDARDQDIEDEAHIMLAFADPVESIPWLKVGCYTSVGLLMLCMPILWLVFVDLAMDRFSFSIGYTSYEEATVSIQRKLVVQPRRFDPNIFSLSYFLIAAIGLLSICCFRQIRSSSALFVRDVMRCRAQTDDKSATSPGHPVTGPPQEGGPRAAEASHGEDQGDDAEDRCASFCTWTAACCAVLLFSLVPIATWFSTVAWWHFAATEFVGCRDHCLARNASTATVVMCAGLGIHREAALLLTASSPPADLRACSAVMNSPERSNFVASMAAANHSFLAFESLLREHHSVAVTDIYGSLFGGFGFVLLIVSQLALRGKMKELGMYKERLAETTFNREQRSGEQDSAQKRYGKLFVFMAMLLWQKPRTVSHGKRVRLDERLTSTVWGRKANIDRLRTSYCKLFRNLAVGLLVALVHAVSPRVHRWWRSKPVLPPVPSLRWIVGANTALDFLSQWLFYFTLQTAYDRFEWKLYQAIAFDALWRFPGETPLNAIRWGLHTIDKRRAALAAMFRESNHGAELGLREGDFTREGFRADFSVHGKGRELLAHVKRLNEWFNVRRYLRLDHVDERISLELPTVFCLVTIAVRFVRIFCSFVVWHQMKVGSTSFQIGWDMAFLFYMVLRSLHLTMTFNLQQSNHMEQLQSLRQHLKLQWSQSVARSPSSDALRDEWGPEEDGDFSFNRKTADQYIDTLQAYIRECETPYAFLGLEVNTSLVRYYLGVVATSLAPYLVFFLSSLKDELFKQG